jgi:RsiW-degrading membrane proteinase PrsW (M82 family)
LEASPPGPRDHLFWIFAAALIPLAVSVFVPQRTYVERMIEELHEEGEDAEGLDIAAAPVPVEDAESFAPPHLPEGSSMHWVYAGVASVVFLGLLAGICGTSASPVKLLTTGLLTGTLGIVALLSFQWFAIFSRGIWFRGGIVALLMIVIKLIGYSYICALRPDTGFLASALGFTFGVGLCEELIKAIPVVWYINSPQSNWKGAMLVGMASGIGFGISEGIMYSADMYNGVCGWMIYLVRFTSCVTLHAVWAGAVGLLMFRDQTYCTDIDWEAALMFVLKYLSIAMVLHGLYDTLLKKNYEVWALAVALGSWMWLAMLFYGQREIERQSGGSSDDRSRRRRAAGDPDALRYLGPA